MLIINQRSADYMDKRRIFTVDPDYFPLARMREIVDYLHNKTQKFGMRSCSMQIYKSSSSETSVDDGSRRSLLAG